MQAAAESEIAGVGIVFRRVKRASGPAMRVVSLAAGSPAKEESIVQDAILTHIDDISIADKTTYEIGKLILGPVGSQVKMRFDNPSGSVKEVSLRRQHLPRVRKHGSFDSSKLESQPALKAQDDLDDRTWWSSVEELGSHMTRSLSARPSSTPAVDSDSNSDALSPRSDSSALSPRSDHE